MGISVRIIIISVFITTLASAKIWHVPTEISTIKSAVEDSAVYGDTVLVAPGNYSPATYEIFPINMKNGVVLISQQGADSTIIDADITARVFASANSDSTTVLSGFTITNGIAGFDTLVDTTFIDSCGGGVMCYNNSRIIIRDNIISKNCAKASGGGIYCDSTSSPNITGNTINENNTSYQGGGICCGGTTRILKNTIILNNASQGGGISCQNYSAVIIKDNSINGNNAHDGGGIASFYNASTNAIHNKICGNTGMNGGGLFNNWSADTIQYNIIQENIGSDGGGLFMELSANSKISQNVIAYNTSTFEGSAMTIDGSQPSVTANTIVSNFNTTCDLEAIFLKFGVSGVEICNNAIMDNRCGVYNHYWEAYDVVINNNNIYFNTYQPYDYEIKHFGVTINAIDARYNWWNTTDSATLASYIWESNGPGHVMFVPFLGAPEPNAPGEPSSVDSIVTMKDSAYSTPIIDPVHIGDTLYIQLAGTGWHSLYIDPAIVILTSNKDNYGIGVALVETDTNSGVFRGRAYIADTSSDLLNIIGVNLQDTIIIRANVDTAICDTVIVVPVAIEQYENKYFKEIFFQCRPNPFCTSTTIHYSAPEFTLASLRIFDINGRLVKNFKFAPSSSTAFISTWTGDDDSGQKLPAGVYFLEFRNLDTKERNCHKIIKVE